MEEKELLIIVFGSFTTVMLFCFCIKYIKEKEIERIEKKIDNIRKKLVAKNIIHPITEENYEEVKDEFEQYEIRRPQISGEENI